MGAVSSFVQMVIMLHGFYVIEDMALTLSRVDPSQELTLQCKGIG